MPTVRATPETLEEVLRRAVPGATISLDPGTYRPLRIPGLRAGKTAPVIIDGGGHASFDGGITLAAFKPRAAQVARDTKRSGRYPGIYPIAYQATLSIERCSWLEIRNLKFVNSWPTAVYISESSDLTFESIRTEGSTYAFYAVGATTRGLKLAKCDWLQDKDLWANVPWADVHEDSDDLDSYNGSRAYDGTFFNGLDIAGDVEVAGCTIEHAFNGVHFFNHDHDPLRARNVHVHDCTFRYIKDNPIEPEQTALNWWIHDNTFFNAHKWFSMELRHAGWIYIFRNRGWFSEKPGPPKSGHRGGSVFKFSEEPEVDDFAGPIHVFNNSWYLRCPLAPQGALRRLRHHNNAIVYCDSIALPGIKDCDTADFFGSITDSDPTRRFTKKWAGMEFDIKFINDCVLHRQWPSELATEYRIEPGIVANPEFFWPEKPDDADNRFNLATGSRCRDQGVAVPVEMPNGPAWVPQGKFHIGWFQDSRDLKFPEYRPMPRA